MHFVCVCVCVCVFWSINSSLASFDSSPLSFDELVQMVPSFLHVVPQSTFFFTNFKGRRGRWGRSLDEVRQFFIYSLWKSFIIHLSNFDTKERSYFHGCRAKVWPLPHYKCGKGFSHSLFLLL
jgi:hypothetical protein